MFTNHIFICHTDKHSPEAKQIATSLRGRGYQVFLDKESLPAGRSYDQQIEKAVKKSSAFVFLISPEAVAEGRYTLTELSYAQKKWPHPANAVLPVMVEPTDLKLVPEYLKGVTILKPQGNLGAEVGSTIRSFLPVRNPAKMFAAVAVIVLAMIGGVIAYQAMKPVSTPYNYTPSTYQTYYNATARCSRTGVVGRGRSTSESQAEEDAIENCVALGGIRGCCQIESVTTD